MKRIINQPVLFTLFYPFNVLARLGVNAYNISLADKQGYIYHSAGFKFDLLDAALGSVTAYGRRRLNNLEIHLNWQVYIYDVVIEFNGLNDNVRF